jgi:drug/metabolite transporter (DMT)-like permease
MSTPRILRTSHGSNRDAFAPLDWGLFGSLGLIWGSSFLFMAIGLDAFHPGLVTWLRVVFGAIVIAAIPKARTTRIKPEDRTRVRVLGVIWIAIPLTLFPIAQQWIDSAVAGMLNGATPVFTALLATILLRALPGRLQMAGLVFGFAGITAIALPSAGAGTTATIGVTMVLVATICYAVAINMIAPLHQQYGSLPVIARAQWVAVAVVTPFGLYGLTQSSFAWPSLLALLAVGVLGTGVAYVLMSTLSGRVGATRSAFINYAIPVVALILGVVFRDELLAPIAVIGVFLVIAGAVLASRREG